MSPGDRSFPVGLNIPRKLTTTFLALACVGAVGFVFGVLGPEPLRAWQAYLVNLLFWMGLSFGAMLFVAVLNMTGGKWGRPLKRLSESFGAYLPVGFCSFWLLYLGRKELFPWIRHPVPGKQSWLNVPFLFVRDGAGLLLLTIVSLALVYFSLRSDREWSRDSSDSARDDTAPWVVSWRHQLVLSPLVGVVYAFVLSLVGFDLVMSLDPRWYSTLFGGYFFIGCFYTAIAAVYLLSLVAGGTEELKGHLAAPVLHDMGKLLLAFCLFTGYLFYAQFLVIWYGNLPEEARHVILRVKLSPWEPLAWTVLFMTFVVPFLILLSRRAKLKRPVMICLSLVIMVGMWLEKFVEVAPSLWTGKNIPLGFTEACVTAGFLGVVGLCLTEFLKRVPLMPVSDPLYRESVEDRRERLTP
ncbi:MAG: hypothetical protein A4E65_03569 [Syntrophorhabdus sp. PtaU1.Bin153]|nr:MAG: hypothetical protein A4E65_03569 [Syntrophorhabdus sp. PtaU1.Bin153]